MSLLFALLLAAEAGSFRPATEVARDPLQCRASGPATTARRCSIAIPASRTVRTCTASDISAGHCAKRSKKHKGRYVAWVVASPGATCKIDKKRTDWSKSITARLSKKSPATATCDLHVELT